MYSRLPEMLSNLYQDIKVFRYDDIIGEIYFLAGVDEGIELVMGTRRELEVY